MSLRPWSERLPGYLYVPDDDLAKFPKLVEQPEGVVFHSGSTGKKLGEYTIDEPDGRCVAYHFAWFESLQAFVQTVPLTVRAWHAGKQGNHWLSIGIPGPYSQDPRRYIVENRVKMLALDLVQAMAPVLRFWCRHSDIDSSRKDPGPGFKDEWMEGLLEWKKAS